MENNERRGRARQWQTRETMAEMLIILMKFSTWGITDDGPHRIYRLPIDKRAACTERNYNRFANSMHACKYVRIFAFKKPYKSRQKKKNRRFPGQYSVLKLQLALKFNTGPYIHLQSTFLGLRSACLLHFPSFPSPVAFPSISLRFPPDSPRFPPRFSILFGGALCVGSRQKSATKLMCAIKCEQFPTRWMIQV